MKFMCLLILLCSMLAFAKSILADDAIKDDPKAHALYDQMIKAMHDADTLSFTSDYVWRVPGVLENHVTYRIWLKKPNQFRMEASKFGSDKISGVLIGDGENLWIYWPDGKLKYAWEKPEEYEKIKFTSYVKRPTPLGQHSISHQATDLNAGMCMTILDASTFHGFTDCMQEYIDGVLPAGTETIRGEDCDIIDVSIMKGQRSWRLWLSKQDHLPRKLQEQIRLGAGDHFTEESWSDISINEPISDDLFKWSPPAGWTQWKDPPIEAGLLHSGTLAPDFELRSIDGGKIHLSDFRGKLVWMFRWRVGCPPCREEIPKVQEIYAKYADKGLVVLGVNLADDDQLVRQVFEQNHVTFPNILDTSHEAWETMEHYETLTGWTAVPMTYIIDREGKVVDAWYGDDQEKREHAIKMLKLDE